MVPSLTRFPLGIVGYAEVTDQFINLHSSGGVREATPATLSAERGTCGDVHPLCRFASEISVRFGFSVPDMIAPRVRELRRRSHSAIGLVDFLIAATALVDGLEYATLNVNIFRCSQPRGMGNLRGCYRLVGVAKDTDDQLVGGG